MLAGMNGQNMRLPSHNIHTMKRTSTLLAAFFLLAASLSSCFSRKPPCPAYGDAEVPALNSQDLDRA